MKKLTIIIPNKGGQTPELTVKSLYRQKFTDFDLIIVNDLIGNANIARNEGFRNVHTPYVLFSDNDINWCPTAIRRMYNMLEWNRELSFAWGSYEMEGRIYCNQEWDAAMLKKRNYISTMAMVKSVDHPGFDPKIKRLQDWDVWLTMLGQGKKGAYIGELAFTTPSRNGITKNSIGWEEAVKALREKHGI